MWIRARHLLTEAVATGGDDERAAELRVRLERIERAQGGGSVPSSGQAAVVDAVPVRSWRRRLGLGAALLIAAALGALLVMAAAPLVQGWFGRNGDVPRVPADVAPAPLPVLSSTDVALIRARTLFARGRLAEALEALDRARPSSTNVADADALRIEIQQALLATAPGRMPAPAGQSGAERP